jgi:hypothetical protein
MEALLIMIYLLPVKYERHHINCPVVRTKKREKILMMIGIKVIILIMTLIKILIMIWIMMDIMMSLMMMMMLITMKVIVVFDGDNNDDVDDDAS